ncbi:sideroflexin 2 [Ectocarpus siliculosus]|uniref:Sideroflexin 2 n=1 Tax=Ectocarpus siliculosus TaxID=2880 RepID=D8LRG7_ECTSI|nr:sideroflexin 2 [Ectocarpus siliculosus]|eukprot:CBN75068.1 sideroflexin 2 [Ectocarpus siliculosus]
MAGLGDMTPAYPGVAELTRQLDQEKIAMLSNRVDDLRNQNQELKNKIFKSENDTHEFVAYFQKEMETKDGIISKLNDELIRKERANKEKALTNQIKNLEGDLSALVRFRELRDAHDKAMEDMAAAVKAKEQAHAQEMIDLERKLLTDKCNLQKDLERVIEDVRRQAKIEAHSSLGGETKRIAGENKRLAKELRFQMQMTTELQAHSKTLEDQTTTTARDVAILNDKDQEYARQGQAKNKELKRLKEQVTALTKALTNEALKGKREGDRTRQEVARELQEQTLDGAGLRQLLMLKNRELRNVRKLSQYILDQRNEVETFFLEALEEVRRYIVDRRQKQYRRAVMEYNLRVREASRNQTKFPKIRDISVLDPGPPSSLPTNPDTKVDISSLTWEDKERVLRLLFAKINNVQGYVDTTPEHPLEAASAAAFPPSVHGSAASQSDNDDARSLQDAGSSNNKSPTFVTQAGRAAAANRSSLEQLTERDIGAAGGAAGGGFVVVGSGSSSGSSARGKGAGNGRGCSSPPSPVLVGVPHEPQAPSVV